MSATTAQLTRAVDRGALLTWIGRHGVACCEDLQLRFDSPSERVAALIAEALEAGLLRSSQSRPCEGPLYAATAAGLRAVGLGSLGVCPVAPRAEAHLRVVARAAAVLERLHGRSCAVLSERELCAGAHAGRWWSQLAPAVHHRGSVAKRPDLLLRPHRAGCGLPLAVEVELSVKPPAQLYAICAAWAACEALGGVLYLAAPAPARALRRAIRRARAGSKITVLALATEDVPALRRLRCSAEQRALCAHCPSAARASARAATRSEKARGQTRPMEAKTDDEPLAKQPACAAGRQARCQRR
jgi:hypothetical protein